MNPSIAGELRDQIEAIYRRESRRVFATLIRLLGDFELAEEALHEAFAAAVEQWQRDGLPDNPRAWLVSAGRFKGIDTIRRRARRDAAMEHIARQLDAQDARRSDRYGQVGDDGEVADDRLRLIFTCCHPALAPATQVALTLREACGLSTDEVASAFLVAPATMAQRIVRGKAKIRQAGIPYRVPASDDLPQRLDAVLSVIYLVFNEGYSATSGETVTRPDLSAEAIRLGRTLVELLPDTEAIGLLALMLLVESRRAARVSPSGDLILLEAQDRSLWNRRLLNEGRDLVQRALRQQPIGAYTLQAAIAAVHADAATAEQTDWRQIVALYDLLLVAEPSPIVELNRAVAVAMRDGAEAGLALVDTILERGDLADYHLAHAARADLCRRLNRTEQARQAYRRALDLARQAPERRFLESRLGELE